MTGLFEFMEQALGSVGEPDFPEYVIWVIDGVCEI
jgi:hypothetical protein